MNKKATFYGNRQKSADQRLDKVIGWPRAYYRQQPKKSFWQGIRSLLF